jgi:hypothetical protein
LLLPPHLQAAIVLLARSAAALAQPQVTITGGADQSGQNYAWTVTHDYDSPMVSVEFPHYMADLCTGPDGWTMRLTGFLGAKGRRGVCSAESTEGLPRGVPLAFKLRVGPRGTPRGEGDVVVRFSDGTEVKVRAQVPVKPSFVAGHLSLIGLGGVFLLLVLISLRRRNKTGATPAEPV